MSRGEKIGSKKESSKKNNKKEKEIMIIHTH
jgi:hypothetical protein